MTGLESAKKQGLKNLLTAVLVFFVLVGIACLLYYVRNNWAFLAAFSAAALIYLLWLVMYGSRLLRGIACPFCSQPLMIQLPDSSEAKLLAFFVPKDVRKCLSCGRGLDGKV